MIDRKRKRAREREKMLPVLRQSFNQKLNISLGQKFPLNMAKVFSGIATLQQNYVEDIYPSAPVKKV